MSLFSKLPPGFLFLTSDLTLQIHETFRPTHQPLYQVKFKDKFPLDKEQAQIPCLIFHVPSQSNFAFIDKLKLAKGSDASNTHDKEPGKDKAKFPDDEQQAAYKHMLKERFFLRFDSRHPISH